MNIEHEVAVLERTSTIDLRKRFAAVCGYATKNRNRKWLIRRIAWRLQAGAQGGLSQRALARAKELANDAELRSCAPQPKPACQDAQEHATVAHVPSAIDPRLPLPGGIITRDYKGRRLQVKVLDQGLEFEGEVYKSLSAIAKHVTGSHCNGYLFFKIGGDR